MNGPETHSQPALRPADRPPKGSYWGLGGMGIVALIREVLRNTLQLNHTGRSAQIAYYAIFSTAPLLILILATSIILPVKGTLESFLAAIEQALPLETANLLRQQIESLHFSTGWGLVGAALLLLGWSGSGVFITLGAGLDAAFGIEQRRHFLRERLISLLLAYLVFASLVLTMILLVFGPRIVRLLVADADWFPYEGEMYHLVRWSIAAGFMLLASSFLYWLAPNVRVRWRVLTPGTLFASLTWVAATVGLDLYVDQFSRYQQTYGALCGIIVLLTWFHLTAFLLLVGGTIDGTIHRALQSNASEPNTA